MGPVGKPRLVVRLRFKRHRGEFPGHPRIERIVHEQVCQHGADRRTLRGAKGPGHSWFVRSINRRSSGRSCMGKLKVSGKPFDISKREVWEAYEKVKANKGAPGVDGCSIDEFEKDLKNNLYKIWNRMSSGSYFPPPVLAVEIPKPHGGGTRILGVPTVADRIAQTVAARRLEEKVEPIFHPDSYGYRPARSALDAVGRCRERCWRYDWVIDLDIQKFFDRVPWQLIVRAVEAHTDVPWVVLYVKRWLAAPVRLPDGTLAERDRGTHPHYRGFTTTTSQSAGAPRDGTQPLAVSAALDAPSHHPEGRKFRGAPSHVPRESSRPDSRGLHAGHRLANRRAPARLLPGPK